MKSKLSSEERLGIANTILRQMGGTGRLSLMVSANHFVVIDSGVQFSFKGSRTMNKVVITLNENDLYDVRFHKIPSMSRNKNSLDKYLRDLEKAETPVNEYEGVYHDMLVNIFESTTGLYLTL